MNFNLPKSIASHIKNADFAPESIGRSGAGVYIFDNGCVLKTEPSSAASDRERDMLVWLDGKLPAPKLIEFECRDGINYLLMTKLNGRMTCDEELFKTPEKVGRILAEGLKMLWDVDISTLPSSAYTLEQALAAAKINLKNGTIDTDDLQYSTLHDGRFYSMEEVFEYLSKNAPTSSELVLCHGDYCLPNVFVGDNGQVSGFLDLGHCGALERWNDVALCLRSLEYNANFYGISSDCAVNAFKEALEMPIDDFKTDYYVLLDEFF